MNRKKFLVITPIVALLCIAMFASLATPQAKAQVIPLNATYCISEDGMVPSAVVMSEIQAHCRYWHLTVTGRRYMAEAAGDGGIAVLTMSASVNAGSAITVYAKAASGYTSSQLYVYVSSSPTGPWSAAIARKSPDHRLYLQLSGILFTVLSVPFRYISSQAITPVAMKTFSSIVSLQCKTKIIDSSTSILFLFLTICNFLTQEVTL